MNECYVYIITNKKNGTLYTGCTFSLVQRIYEHKNCFVDCFTSKYKLNRLVYYEIHGDQYSALCREKQIKRWHRKWKIDLIEISNKNWDDLYEQIIG
jgi:putative endonuclease